jgi:hypothetical protein
VRYYWYIILYDFLWFLKLVLPSLPLPLPLLASHRQAPSVGDHRDRSPRRKMLGMARKKSFQNSPSLFKAGLVLNHDQGLIRSSRTSPWQRGDTTHLGWTVTWKTYDSWLSMWYNYIYADIDWVVDPCSTFGVKTKIQNNFEFVGQQNSHCNFRHESHSLQMNGFAMFCSICSCVMVAMWPVESVQCQAICAILCQL